MSTYTYSVASDTLNATVSIDRLEEEIRGSSIVTALDGINNSADVLDIIFKESISGTDQTTLDGLVGAHDGTPLEDPVVPTEVIVDSQPAFTAKILPNGKKLYSRVHGKEFAVSAGSNTLNFSVPYPAVKFNELEIIGCEAGDKVTLKILDDSSGTYTTVPNSLLNTFGTDVYVPKDYYSRASSYDADLYQNMVICIEMNSVTAKTVYINYILHELKD